MAIDDSMHGRMLNSLQSYDLMDNKKYKNLEALLDAMRETFGFNEDISGLVKNSLSEANYMLGMVSVDIKKMIANNQHPTTQL